MQAEVETDAVYLPAIISFLKERLAGWYNAHFAPDIPEKTVSNARVACHIPDDDKMLAIVDRTLFGEGKDCVVFTERGIYNKPAFHDPVSISYQELSTCPYLRLKEIFSVTSSDSPEKDMAAICQQVKTIVMYGNSDFRKPPPDPEKDTHPVWSWFIGVGSFMMFVVIVPGIVWCEWLGPAGYNRAGGTIALISMLAWFIWFNSHHVSPKKSERFSFSTILIRVIFGGLVTFGFVGAVISDKLAASPDGFKLAETVPLIVISLLGAALCVGLFFKAQSFIHNKQRGSRVKRVVARYTENKRASGTAGLLGLLDAGVCELSDDADIRNVCRILAGQSEHPMGHYEDVLSDVNLMAFFEHARDYGYDFDRHGRPDEIVMAIGRTFPCC